MSTELSSADSGKCLAAAVAFRPAAPSPETPAAPTSGAQYFVSLPVYLDRRSVVLVIRILMGGVEDKTKLTKPTGHPSSLYSLSPQFGTAGLAMQSGLSRIG